MVYRGPGGVNVVINPYFCGKLMEMVLRAALLQMDITVIMITHRLSTVVGADQILVLDKGRIVEQGTPEDIFQHPQSARLQDFLSKVL